MYAAQEPVGKRRRPEPPLFQGRIEVGILGGKVNNEWWSEPIAFTVESCETIVSSQIDDLLIVMSYLSHYE